MKNEKQQKQEQPRPKAKWQRPQLQQLRVSLDTALEVGSFSDGFANTAVPPT